MRKFMIFFAIIVLCIICLVVGGFFGVYITFENGEKFCEKLVESNDEIQNGNDDDIVAYDENGNIIMIKDFDKYFLSLGVKLEDNFSFIISSNSTFSSSYVGAMYDENISDEYKVLYTLNRMFYDNSSLYDLVYSSVDNKNDEDMLNTSFKLKYETINTLIGSVFVDSEIDKDFKTTDGMYYEQITSVNCDNGICEVEVQTELEEDGLYSSYLTALISESVNEETGYTEYVVSSYYIESTSDENLFKLYDKKDGTLIKSVKITDSINLEFDSFKEYFDEFITYKYIFNEDGLYLETLAM